MMTATIRDKLMTATLAALLASAVPAGAQAPQMPPPSVTVAPAVVGEYTLTTRLPGRIKASTTAEVRPQVSGIISEELFKEGSWVEAGQPLYKIEDAVYLAAVAAAEAAVAQAQANYDLAVLDADRAEELFATKAGSAAGRDKAVATRDAAAANLQLAKAQLTSAGIDLDRTTVRAPVSGVIGLSQANTGSLVGAQQAAALATIRTLDPVYVDVTQSVNDLMRWNTPGKMSEVLKAAEATLILPDGAVFEHKGQLKAAEPQVEPTTGMVTLRISFANPDFLLLPGLYVEVVLPQATEKNAILVSQPSVMRDVHGGANVWVVEDGRIAVRPVTVLGTSGSDWVVTSGLKDGEQIVTSGFQKAGPGAEVQIAPPEGDAAAGATTGTPDGTAPAEGN